MKVLTPEVADGQTTTILRVNLIVFDMKVVILE